jgi:hypothetical protein
MCRFTNVKTANLIISLISRKAATFYNSSRVHETRVEFRH